jgi:hypothetical protein
MSFSGRSATNYKRSDTEPTRSKGRACQYLQYVILIGSIFLLAVPHPGASATTGRVWSYLNLTSIISPNWSFNIMPGLRYEFTRTDDPSLRPNKEFYFYELLTGPTWTKRCGRITLRIPLWYYYMGFPSPDEYFYAHNIEFLPILSYRSGKLGLTSRTIFHNTIYASVYDTSKLKTGYSLVIRQLLQVAYSVDQQWSIMVADEPFFGVIEDEEAPPSAIGFWPKGFRLNRLYAGFQYRISPRIAITPQYVLETAYDDGSRTDTNHYLFVTFSYAFSFCD